VVAKQPAVYILASRRNGTLYIGVTSSLPKRVWEHKNDVTEGFTKRYGVHLLVWYELYDTMESAIRREKAIKEVEARMEVGVDREDQSHLARPLCVDCLNGFDQWSK